MSTAFAGDGAEHEDCGFPPGRAWDMLHRLPVIPGPQWDRFERHGRFTPGIERHRQETLDCLSKAAVVVRGKVIRLEELLLGVLPPGWYRGPIVDERDVPTDDPADVPPRPERIPWSPYFALDKYLPGGRSEIACPVGPTRDLLIPYPLRDSTLPIPQRRADGAVVYPTRRVLMGEFGSWLLRLPGQGHVLNNTGVAIGYVGREWLAPLGRAWFNIWNRARASGMIRTADLRFSDRVYGWHAWAHDIWRGYELGWYTAPFALSHMGCPRNHYPLHSSGHIKAGLAGEPVQYRWRYGGELPLSPTSTSFDVYDEGIWNPVTRKFLFWELLHPWDADGNNYVLMTPEAQKVRPFEYVGRDYVWHGWPGPRPGQYLQPGDFA